MITGLGIDLCEIARMETLIRDGRFLERYFNKEEQEYIGSKGQSGPQTMAGIFAAKEALGKALGVGITADLKEITITHDESGAPHYILMGEYARLAEDRRVSLFHLSITHDAGVAAAVCIAERNG